MCYSLIRHHSAEEVHIYLLDFGSEVFKCFAEAPQVGDVLFSYEREKVVNLFRMLDAQLEYRKKVCSEFGGDFLSLVRKGGEKLPSSWWGSRIIPASARILTIWKTRSPI